MKQPKKAANTPAKTNVSNNTPPIKSLTLKDYLEAATISSQRTRSITIVMVVASVLVLVSILNSSDDGWITLRLAQLGHKTSQYAVEKYPLLCKCDPLVQATQPRCSSIDDEDHKEALSVINKIDKERETVRTLWLKLSVYLKNLKTELGELKARGSNIKNNKGAINAGDEVALKETQAKAIEAALTKLDEREQQQLKVWRQFICSEEDKALETFSQSMQRSAADTKYTVRAPFFGVAFDINDVGILGGLSLSIVLILLRLSLRNQIISLRIGFKKARASGQENDFYEILAARQTFVFPRLRDRNQKPYYGWLEQWWRRSEIREVYRAFRTVFIILFDKLKTRMMTYLKIEEEKMSPANLGEEERPAPPGLGSALLTLFTLLTTLLIGFPKRAEETNARANINDDKDIWQANRHVPLRIVPKLLSLLPFLVYSLQFSHDIVTLNYGFDLNSFRTWSLVISSLIFLLLILVLGLWCMSKWSELDKLWDGYDKRREYRKRRKRKRRKTLNDAIK